MQRFFLRSTFCLAVFALFAGSVTQAAVRPGPIKGSGPVVFYLASNERRYAFPDEQTFKTWYRDFSVVRTVSDAEIGRYVYGGNVTYRPGTRLLKRRGDSRIYTVGRGGMLRWIVSGSVASALYGSNWPRLVDELPEARMADYVFSDPVRSARDIASPLALRQATPTVEQNRRSASLVSSPASPSVTSSADPLTVPARSTVSSPSTTVSMRAPATPVVWPGQTARVTAPSTTPSAPSSSRDASSYPGALRTVNVSTELALREAVRVARPGDVIRVSGDYRLSRQLWIEAKGTSANPIYLVAANGKGSARFTMAGGTDEGINIGNGAQHFVLDGLSVSRTGNNVVHVQGNASYITLRNLVLSDAGMDGDVIKVNQANHILIEGCDLARPGRRADATQNAWQEVIDVLDADDVVIRRNWIYDFGNLAGYVKGGSEGVRIEDNVIDGQRVGTDGEPAWGIGGWTDSDISRNAAYESVRVTFSHNVIAHAVYGALGVYNALDTKIENNLFLNNAGVIVQMRAGNGAEQATEGVQMNNNYIVDTRGSMPNVCEVQSHVLRNFTATNNLYWNNGARIPDESDCGFVPGTETGARVENRNFTDVRPTTYEEAMALLTRWD